jgi:hypothetical protein
VSELVGTPSDEVPAILAEGRSGVSTIFVSMSARHPDGRDSEYLYWHTYDHRPEQHRLASVRASMRLVSTPECRAARAASRPLYDETDHVMTYFFADIAGLEDFKNLSAALGDAQRKPYLLPVVQRGVYSLDGTVAASRIKVGADVLAWWPALGVYLLVEEGTAPADELSGVAGVAGAWWGTGSPAETPGSYVKTSGQQITYLFLDRDPVATAEDLRPQLAERWGRGRVKPLLAAPFHTLDPRDLTRHLP